MIGSQMDVLLPGRSASQTFVCCQHEKSRQKHSGVNNTRKEARVQAERTFLQRGMTFESRRASSALGKSPSLSPPRARTGTEIWSDDREELGRSPQISERQVLYLISRVQIDCKASSRRLRKQVHTDVTRKSYIRSCMLGLGHCRPASWYRSRLHTMKAPEIIED